MACPPEHSRPSPVEATVPAGQAIQQEIEMVGDLFSSFEVARAIEHRKSLAEYISMELALHSMIARDVFVCRADQPADDDLRGRPSEGRDLAAAVA